MALKNKCTKSPRYTPDGKTLIWLQRDVGGPHMSNMELCRSLDFVSIPSFKIYCSIVFLKFQLYNFTETS